MKKLLVGLIVSLLVLTGCGSKNDGPTLVENQKDETLTIAVPSTQNASFVTGYSSNAYDRWVTNMLYGYGVFYVDRETGEMKDNPTVVESVVTEADDAGNKTYTFKIKTGLKYSDGTEITAKDFVFSILFRSAPQFKEYATIDGSGYELLGFGDYTGTNAFEGVKLVDDTTFSLTISAAELPYFFERSFVGASPDPMHVYFPNAKLNAEGNGFDNTSEEISAAAKYVAEEEQYAPTIASGPYKFVSYQDGVTTLALNEEYAGNYEGKKAEIGTIVFRLVNSAQIVDTMKKGEADVSQGNIEGKYIDEIRAEDSGVNWTSYPRNGYGQLTIKANKGVTQYKEVRQAIAFLLNRDQFVQEIVGGYGSVVNGPHGISQWFYKDRKDELNEAIVQYALNLDEANSRLDASPYKFNQDGTTPWDASKSEFRYNEAGEILEVFHFGSEDNDVTELLKTQLPTNAAKVGMKYTIDQGPFATLGAYMQELQENKYNVFNLATSFTAVYDRYYAEHSDWAANAGYNWSQIADADLDAAIVKMRRLEGTQRDEFADAFVEYMTVWNDLLPSIPLYSNDYHDFYTARVTGYEDTVTTLSDFSQNIEYFRIVSVD